MDRVLGHYGGNQVLILPGSTQQILPWWLNTLRPRQDGRHFPDDIFKCILLNENVWILIKISLKFVPKGPINNIPALVQIMAWRRPGDKPLSEPIMVSLLTHICITQPQWFKIELTCVPYQAISSHIIIFNGDKFSNFDEFTDLSATINV